MGYFSRGGGGGGLGGLGGLGDIGGGGSDNWGRGIVDGSWWNKASGREGSREDSQAYGSSLENQKNDSQGVADTMKQSDTDYYNKMNDVTSGYQTSYMQQYNKDQDKAQKLADAASAQSTDAQKTYTNTIKPEMMNIMEDAKKNAGQAMSLKDASDPNNAVATGVRNMYEQQAQGINKQALADSGTLSALGAQAFAGQMGSMGPMTGGQMQALAGQNMSQAGQAYQNAQQRMQSLREQGINKSLDQSNQVYQFGQQAKDRYSGSVKDIQNAQGVNQSQQQGYRGEINGLNNQMSTAAQAKNQMYMQTQGGMASLGYGQAQQQAGRQQGIINQYYGGQQAGLAGSMAQKGQAAAGMTGMLGQAGGSALGGYFGGPAGAAAGGAAGKGATQNMGETGGYTNAAQSGYNYGGSGGYNYGGGYTYPAAPGAGN